jgi:16S rRNA (guanine966-N2)-methyltransferase
MRIIAGTRRGMRLFSPRTAASRPITDRVKESLFSVLCKYDLPGGKMVADLFCGVGSLGLEALSRGAEFVTFVEKDPKIVATLERNIEKAGFVKETRVITSNAFKIGAPVGSGDRPYELVFVDPPYACTREVDADSPLGRLLDLLGGRIAPDGLVVARTNRQTFLLEQYGRLRIVERREWGTMAVTILKVQASDE